MNEESRRKRMGSLQEEEEEELIGILKSFSKSIQRI